MKSNISYMLDCGVDLGPVGEDLEGPGLAPGVGPSWVLPVET